MDKSKGFIEAEISNAITQWEKNFLRRGSVSVKTDMLRDMIIVSLKGILSPAEYTVCKTKEGLLSIKKIRSELVESGIKELCEIILNLTKLNVISFHTDLSTHTGERIMVFRLEENFEKTFYEG